MKFNAKKMINNNIFAQMTINPTAFYLPQL